MNKGYDVHAAASSKEGGKKEIKELGVKCHEINFSRSVTSLNNLKAIYQLHNLFKKNHYNLVHVHTPIASFLVRLVASFYEKIKVLYTVHGFHFFKGAPLKNWIFYYPAEKIASYWTDGLIDRKSVV